MRLGQERISKDKMHLHVNAYQQMQYVCTQMAFFELKVGGITTTAVEQNVTYMQCQCQRSNMGRRLRWG